MSKDSVSPGLAGVLPGFPTDVCNAVVKQGVAEQRVDGVQYASGRGFEIDSVTHQKRHECSALRLQQVVARLADKPGFSGVERQLTQLLETTKRINDGEVLIEIGKLLLFHGAHCMDAVRRGRKPYYRVDLGPAEMVQPTEFPRWSDDHAGAEKPETQKARHHE